MLKCPTPQQRLTNIVLVTVSSGEDGQQEDNQLDQDSEKGGEDNGDEGDDSWTKLNEAPLHAGGSDDPDINEVNRRMPNQKLDTAALVDGWARHLLQLLIKEAQAKTGN
ncbi:hypothetical protein FS749_003618 [Ceratobasidium sp. UAMH 11750]|nr:hypothetical protein FS749_003618 [Ceratobasidium sp. UAMH 11750]